jgi:iron complex outermembrane receptor protein
VKNTVLLAPLVITSLLTPLAFAGNSETEQIGDGSRLEIVIVTGVRMDESLVIETSQLARPGVDNSDLLRLFPGGNRNANGPLTRISQYRGLFGAQNNVAIDGFAYSSDCPNWMDSPLSSIPQSLTGSVTLFRGLGSVDTIQEGLGGGIEITPRKGGFSEDEAWSSYGTAEAGYASNASAWNASVFAGFHNRDNWLDVAASQDKGDDYEFDGGVVAATEYDRAQYRVGYGRRISAAELNLTAVINRTNASGTPALPMDIRFVDSEMYSFTLDNPVGPGELTLGASTLSVNHVMDNFTLRPPPLNMKGKESFRQSAPFGDAHTARASYRLTPGAFDLEIGIDGKWESHTAKITDPTNEQFFILNFNDIQRDRAGLYALVTRQMENWDLEAGVRYNRVTMNAGEVGGDLAMPMMPPMDGILTTQQDRLDELAAAFNAADRRKRDHQWSATLKASRALGDSTRLNVGLGRKVRSPSYQERYLWTPLEATSGLADGRTYIGDINLKPEKSIELTAGIDWTADGLKLAPEVFYRDINDYIQGVPSSNETANQFAMMMNGKPPLQYANVDAKMYGADLAYEWSPAESWLVRGNLSYVRGKRRDVRDNLYRIAPLSSFLEVMYVRERYFLSVESVAAARQDQVAEYNDEQETAGWGILNLRAGMDLGRSFNLGLGVENLFDKVYRDHLGGYNRVRESDVPLGTRLYSKGRSFYIKLNASW